MRRCAWRSSQSRQNIISSRFEDNKSTPMVYPMQQCANIGFGESY